MLEIFIIITVLFVIAVLFYKQANEEFEILQIQSDRIEELQTLYADKSPIVVTDFQTPALGTRETLDKRPNILEMTIEPTRSLKTLLDSPSLSTFQFTQVTASFLAKESGLSVWFEHHLYTQLIPYYTKWLYSFNTSLWPDHRGLFKTTAFQTMIMPTQGTAKIILMLGKVLPYFPARWQGRNFHSLSIRDTPLINQIEFMEIKLRRGDLLFLPAHMIVDISNAWCFIAEIHHPISRLA